MPVNIGISRGCLNSVALGDTFAVSEIGYSGSQ